MTRNRWLILFVLFLARTAMGFQFQSIASVSPLLIKDLSIDLAMFGALVGSWMLPGVFGAIPGGLLGQRAGDKQVVLFGLALMVGGGAVVASADSYTLVFSGRVISGAGAVLLNVLLAKMVADWFADRELATAMGILVVSWPLGIGVALVLLGPLAAHSSWSFAIQVTAWVCAVALVCVAVVYRRPDKVSGADRTPRLSWLSHREFALVCIAGLIWTLYNVGYIVVVTFSPVLLVEKGLSTTSAAVVSSSATWPLIATIPIGGVLADRTGRRQEIMLASLIAVALIMPFMLVAPSPLIVLAVIGILTGPAAGIIMALPVRVLSLESRHLGMGIFFTLYYLGMALLPGIAGWFRDLTQIDAAPLLFGSALLLIAAALSVLFHRFEASPVAELS